MKRKIILHGYLKDLYPAGIEVEADTIAEALRALENFPELQREDGSPHLVEVDGVGSDIALFAATKMTEIHVRPRTGGAGGKNGLMQILIGVVLIAVALVFPAGIAIGSMTIGTSGFLLSGVMMVLGGVVQLLTPSPENTKTESSKYLGAGGNTVEIGTRIPLIYGTRKAYGHYLSFDVDAIEMGTAPTEDASVSTPVSEWDPYQGILPGAGLTAVSEADYHQHDVSVLPVPLAPVRPVYASSVTSPTGYPIDFWSPAA